MSSQGRAAPPARLHTPHTDHYQVHNGAIHFSPTNTKTPDFHRYWVNTCFTEKAQHAGAATNPLDARKRTQHPRTWAHDIRKHTQEGSSARHRTPTNSQALQPRDHNSKEGPPANEHCLATGSSTKSKDMRPIPQNHSCCS